MTQTQFTKTYFLAPGWDITLSSAVLGSIVTNPSDPSLAFFQPAALTTNTTASLRVSFDSSRSDGDSNSATTSAAGLFFTFLSAHGLGDEPAFSFDRKRVLSYSFRHQRSVDLSPSPELLRAAVADPRVTELLAAGVAAYMITGVRVVSGAAVKVPSSKGNGWVAELGVGSTRELSEEMDDANRVFAVQVAEIKVEEGGEVVLRQLTGEASAVQAELDGKFGEGAYKVVEGVDEAAFRDTGEADCLIVTASPIFVDPLTAGTRKVGGEHGIWY